MCTEAARDGVPSHDQDSAAGPVATDVSSAGHTAASEGLLCVNAGGSLLLSTLHLAMREGRCLLIEDVGTTIDPVLDPVLRHTTISKVSGPSATDPFARERACLH